METTNFKSLMSASLLCLTLNLFSQTGTISNEGCEDCVGGSSVNSQNCISAATTWFLGGNQIIPPTYVPPGWSSPFPPQTDIGTCNDFPFILKANNNKSIYILPNSRIGIGYLNSAPSAVLDIRDGNAQVPSNFRIYGDATGNLESTTDITMNYFTGKSFVINEGPVNASVSRLFMQNGKVGLNTNNPVSNLDIFENGAAGIRLHSLTNNSSFLWTLNSIMSYNFGTDATGVGQIGTNISSPVTLLNFRLNTANNKAQVWVGKRPTTGAHTDFSFAVDGKLVANSIYVTLQGNWADYVFEDSYQLTPLLELEKFYKNERHLPEVPSASEIKENGIDLEQMNILLLKKIEELTLYLVQQQKEINSLKKQKG